MKGEFKYKDQRYVIESTTYRSTETTALMVYRKGHRDSYTVITVNLPDSAMHSEDFVYIDTNNCSWAEDFLKKTGLGDKIDGVNACSGFCRYPLYHINLEKLQ